MSYKKYPEPLKLEFRSSPLIHFNISCFLQNVKISGRTTSHGAWYCNHLPFKEGYYFLNLMSQIFEQPTFFSFGVGVWMNSTLVMFRSIIQIQFVLPHVQWHCTYICIHKSWNIYIQIFSSLYVVKTNVKYLELTITGKVNLWFCETFDCFNPIGHWHNQTYMYKFHLKRWLRFFAILPKNPRAEQSMQEEQVVNGIHNLRNIWVMFLKFKWGINTYSYFHNSSTSKWNDFQNALHYQNLLYI